MGTIHDKIASMLNMTVEKGCTEDEAETAMRLAASLAIKHGIDLASLQPKGAPKRKATFKRNEQGLKPHQVLAAEAAAALYGVECNVYGYGDRGFAFVGREENIELAEQTMFWLFRQIEELYKQALPKGLSKTARGEFRKTFKAACALRVKERARDVVRGLQTSGIDTTNAVTVQGYFEALQEEISEYWSDQYKPTPEQQRRAAEYAAAAKKWREDNPEEAAKRDAEAAKILAREAKRAAKRKGPRGRSLPWGSGSNAGYDAGDQVKLRKDVK